MYEKAIKLEHGGGGGKGDRESESVCSKADNHSSNRRSYALPSRIYYVEFEPPNKLQERESLNIPVFRSTYGHYQLLSKEVPPVAHSLAAAAISEVG